MSSYFSSLTSSTTISSLSGRLNSLRRAITSGEEADDPDNEDSSHISNVLRAYYAETGRPFPQWLPPDPKTPTPQPRMVATQASLQQGNNPYGQGPGHPPPRGGGLGDLWSDGPSQPPPSQTASLRNRPVRGQVASANLRPMQSQTPPPESISRRPLPSQRAGSYQSASSVQSQPQSGYGMEKVSSGSSAQQRLRARFHGGSANSPSPPPQSQSPYMRSSRP